MRKETVEIKRMGINGEGIAYIDRKIVFVKGALVGEEVVIGIDKNEPRYMTGHIIKINKKSSQRNEKGRHQFSGYSLFHMNYQDQLHFKRDQIKEAILKYTDFTEDSFDVKPVIESDRIENYRQYAAFPIVFHKGKLIFGDLKNVDHFLTSDDLYRLQDPLVNKVLGLIVKILNKYGCKDYYPRVKSGLRYIMLKKVNDKMQVIFVTGKDGIKKQVTQDIEKIPQIQSVYYTINTSSHTDFNDKGFKRIYGSNKMVYSYQGRDFELSVKSPAIINPEMDDKLYTLLKEHIQNEDKILSLYCGLGIFEMSLDNKVDGVDENEFAIEDARRNKDRFNLVDKTFRKGAMDDEVVYLCKKNHYDVAIINLEQEEMSESIAQSMMISKVERILLVAKNMSVLAKGMSKLQSRYHIKFVGGVDHDPNTPLVKAVVEMEINK